MYILLSFILAPQIIKSIERLLNSFWELTQFMNLGLVLMGKLEGHE